MKYLCRKFVSLLLAAILCVQLLPTAALAALTDNSPAYNQEILSALKEIVGSEEEAERYYAVLEQYGLLDEDGSVPDQWEIYMDGEQVTLDEVKALLEEPDCDLEKQLLVDGSVITLGDLQTMLEIEDYIAYLRATYFNGTEWTEEQKASLESLMAQIENQGIQIYTAEDGTVFPSGVSHSARVTVSEPEYGENGTTATFTVSLTHANKNQTVTFHYEAQSGSQKVSGTAEGTVMLTADANGSASENIIVTLDTDYDKSYQTGMLSDMDLTWFLQLTNLKNALFSSNGKTAQTVTCRAGAGSVERVPTESNFTLKEDFSKLPSNSSYFGNDSNSSRTVTLTDDQQLAIRYGLTKRVDISQSTVSATYADAAKRKILYTFEQLSENAREKLKEMEVDQHFSPPMSRGILYRNGVSVTGFGGDISTLKAEFKYDLDDSFDNTYDKYGGKGGHIIYDESVTTMSKDLTAEDAVPELTVTSDSQMLHIYQPKKLNGSDKYVKGYRRLERHRNGRLSPDWYSARGGINGG